MKEKTTVKEGWQKLREQLGPAKLFALLAVGLVLLFLSMPTENDEKEVTAARETPSQNSYRQEMEAQLTELLSQVQGIGKVKVMITLAESSEQVVLKDTPVQEESIVEEDEQGTVNKSTKISREEATVGDSPYIIKTLEPEVRGVVVLAEGGNNVTVAAEIVGAVQVLFDLPAHKIKVMKYK